ncbi:MAG TPA: ISAs1 family transposase, partial [Streptosporangiaceae bacterium]|nr:ISAs1 family transposase [Streptosporangiaceae bacterium]
LVSKEIVHAVTSLDAEQAGPADLAAIARGQWGIESVHWIRTPGAGLAVASCGADATRMAFSC